jgi:dihydroceramidase
MLNKLEKAAILCLAVGFLAGCSSFLWGFLAHQGAVGNVRKGNTESGYWGPVESSVDWCEENYVAHPQVAEWHNTVSSFLIALAGLAVIVAGIQVGAEKRYLISGFWLMVTGLGSVGFHGALTRGLQALDEVPMLWTATTGAYCCLEHHTPKPKYGKLLPFLSVVFLSVLTLLNVSFHGTVAVAVFHLSFAPIEVFFAVQSIRLYAYTIKNPTTKRAMIQAFFSYAAAMLTWSLDNHFCLYLQNLPFGLPNPQLHAWGWHGCVAFATYSLNVALIEERMRVVLKEPVQLTLWLGFIPILSRNEKKRS